MLRRAARIRVYAPRNEPQPARAREAVLQLECVERRVHMLFLTNRLHGSCRIQSTGGARTILETMGLRLISVLMCEKISVSGWSTESASFISEFYSLHKNPTQPRVSTLAPTGATS
jgi:hypothetical protein